MGCLSRITDLNCSVNPSDFINCTAFLVNFGVISICSQLILPKATFLLPSSHLLFLFPLCARHLISRCLADCNPRLHEHSGESIPRTFLESWNFSRSIFSELIFTIGAPAALRRPLNISFAGFGQIVCSSLPVFSLDRAFPRSSKAFCSDASLMTNLAPLSSCLSAIYLESHSLHFLSLLFALLYPAAGCFGSNAYPLIPFYSLMRGYLVKVEWYTPGSQAIQVQHNCSHNLRHGTPVRIFEGSYCCLVVCENSYFCYLNLVWCGAQRVLDTLPLPHVYCASFVCSQNPFNRPGVSTDTHGEPHFYLFSPLFLWLFF